jgi:hypothetical protein
MPPTATYEALAQRRGASRLHAVVGRTTEWHASLVFTQSVTTLTRYRVHLTA